MGKEYNFGNKDRFDDLDTETMLEIVDKLHEGNVTRVQILGGEPFFRKDILLILDKLAKLVIKISINTNGHLLNELIIEKLIELGVEELNFSFDGPTAQVNDLIRGKGAFEKTLKFLKMTLNKVAKNDVKMSVGVNFVLTKLSLDRAQELVQFCEKNGVKELAVNDLWVTQNAEANEEMIALTDIHEKIDFVEELIMAISDKGIKLNIEMLPLMAGYLNYKYQTKFQTFMKCVAGEKLIYIKGDGQVYPCIKCREMDILFDKFSNIKTFNRNLNIQNYSLNEIMNSDFFNVFRHLRQVDLKTKKSCQNCLYIEYCSPCPLTFYNNTFQNECLYIDKLLEKIIMENE